MDGASEGYRGRLVLRAPTGVPEGEVGMDGLPKRPAEEARTGRGRLRPGV